MVALALVFPVVDQLNAGSLRHQLTVQQPVMTQDASGDPVVSWTTLGTIRGAIEPLRGREVTLNSQILSEMDTRITVRYSPMTAQITALHRLVHQGTPFNIISIAQKDLGQREIEILCRSGINNG